MSKSLQVWMNGELVGRWLLDRGIHAFSYSNSWLNTPHSRPLSLSLPLTSTELIKGAAVKNYFDNLLPDNDKIRERIGQRFQTSSDVFSLLEAIGRDCVGAVQILPDGARPENWQHITAKVQSTDNLAERLRNLSSAIPPLQDDDFFRISIAGAQEKTAFTLWQGQWCVPQDSTPSTHIFKPALGMMGLGNARVDASDSVYNEWLCAQILIKLGLATAHTEIAHFGDETVLVVERFDRAWADDGKWIARLPQEDFCQALGIAPDKKYEQFGGPGMQQCLQLLHASAEKTDLGFFILAQFAFYLLAAPDGHAKNFSLFLHANNAYQMTPLYDVLSAWPYIGNQRYQLSEHKAGLAMALRSKNAHYRFKEMQARHWQQLALQSGGPIIWDLLLACAERVETALKQVAQTLPADFPPHTWTSIATGMRAHAQRFLQEAQHLD